MSDFRCIERIQMRFRDIDMFQHVNNTCYFEYLDYGKTQYFKKVLGDLFDTDNDAMVIVNVNCSFIHPTRYDEPVEVATRAEKIGEHSITFLQRISNVETGEVKCEARVVMVGYNARKADKIVIPDTWRKAIEGYEQGLTKE